MNVKTFRLVESKRFVAFVEDKYGQYDVLKMCVVFCAKPKEVDPNIFNFCMTNKCFDITQVYNQQQSIEINWISSSIKGIHIFLFFDIENVCSCYSIPLAQ